MTPADEALGEAMRALAATDRPGTAHTLGPASSGHYWCQNCRAHTAIRADVLRIDANGLTPIATFYHCEKCPAERRDLT